MITRPRAQGQQQATAWEQRVSPSAAACQQPLLCCIHTATLVHVAPFTIAALGTYGLTHAHLRSENILALLSSCRLQMCCSWWCTMQMYPHHKRCAASCKSAPHAGEPSSTRAATAKSAATNLVAVGTQHLTPRGSSTGGRGLWRIQGWSAPST